MRPDTTGGVGQTTDAMDAVSDTLSPEEQTFFLRNLRVDTECADGGREMVVDMADTSAYLGFARKDGARRLMAHGGDGAFTIGTDFTDTRLTPFAFKELCMLAPTARGQMARRYYLHLETALQRILRRGRTAGADPGAEASGAPLEETLYVYQEATGQGFVFVNDDAGTHVLSYSKKCGCAAVLRSSVAHMLRSYSVDGAYRVPFGVLRKTLDDAQAVLDGGAVGAGVIMTDACFADRVDEVLNNARANATTKADEEPRRTDVATFLAVCCSSNGGGVAWEDLAARYSMWCRDLSSVVGERLQTYFADAAARSDALARLELLELPPLGGEEVPSSDVAAFVAQSMRRTLHGSMRYDDARSAFLAWKATRAAAGGAPAVASAKLSKGEKKAVRAILDREFVSDGRAHYVFAELTVPVPPSAQPADGGGRTNRKAVEQLIDRETGSVIRTFASMTTAAASIGVTPSALSVAIANGRPCQGASFRFAAQPPAAHL